MTVRVSIKTQINAKEITKRKGLEKGGPAQRFFTHEVRRLSDPYVPFDKGVLKNTAREAVDHIIYPQIYAKKQYYEHRGSGIRGRYWDRRMVAQRGPELLHGVAKFIGGTK
jgi:hypothetical protein